MGALLSESCEQIMSKDKYTCTFSYQWRLLCLVSFKYFAMHLKNVYSLVFAARDAFFWVLFSETLFSNPIFCNNRSLILNKFKQGLIVGFENWRISLGNDLRYPPVFGWGIFGHMMFRPITCMKNI